MVRILHLSPNWDLAAASAGAREGCPLSQARDRAAGITHVHDGARLGGRGRVCRLATSQPLAEGHVDARPASARDDDVVDRAV